MLAPNRTELFAIWRACERFGILPPDVKSSWDECDVIAQAHLLAYEQLQSHDETEIQLKLAGARMPTS